MQIKTNEQKKKRNGKFFDKSQMETSFVSFMGTMYLPNQYFGE